MAKKPAVKPKGGRPRQVAEYHEGKEAQNRFMAAMQTIIGAKKK